MRIAVTLSLVAIGCGASSPDDAPRANDDSGAVAAHAPVTPLVPPSPAGCLGAAAYDACFAVEGATPLALRVALPPEARAKAVAVVRFPRAWGAREPLDLDELKFVVGEARELRLYFQ